MSQSTTGSSVEDAPAFTLHQHGHRDMVECSSFNSYGNRFAIGSADGKIKVFDRSSNGTWSLCDTWSAHNAEILEVSIKAMPIQWSWR